MIGSDDRQQAERELQQLVDAVPQHIVVLSADGKRLYGNQAACDYHGLTPGQFLVEPITNCFHPDDIQDYRQVRDTAIANGEPWEAEARLRRGDGRYRWFLIRGKPLLNDQGSVTRWYLTRTDIEDRKQTEKDLQRLVDAVPQHMLMHSADGRRLYANKITLDFLGRTLQEFLDEKKAAPFHPDDLASFFETRQRGISGGMPFEMEARLRRNDGQYRWFLFRYNPLRNEQGEIVRWYSTGTDIEDLKRVERELRGKTETLAVFQKLVQSSMEGILAFDREGRYTVWNAALERIFGVNDLERLGNKASDLCPFFHLTGGLNCYHDALAGKGVLAADVPYVLTETRKQVFLDAHFSPLLDEEGKIIGGLAIIRDVTERKRAEDALRRSEAYLAEAQRLSHTGSWAWDYHGKEINHWSPETYRVFGFDPAAGPVSWKEARTRIHPDDLESFDRNKEQVATERVELEFDFRLVHPDGSNMLIVSAVPLRLIQVNSLS